ncbi:MAG TPA: CMD domain protein, partial [Rhodopila sp.]
MNDVIDLLAGLAPDSPLAMIRDRKPITRQQAQASHRALFEPADPGDVTAQERFAIASFVAGLHAQDQITAFYTAGLAR